MPALLQILHTQESGGHIREWYPWEYDSQAQECIYYAQRSDPAEFFLQQAKIFQKRADYIRQVWAKQASQSPPAPQAPQYQITQPIAPQYSTQYAPQYSTQSASQPSTQQSTQSASQPAKQPVTPSSKKKRNQKTRQQYKKKAQAQAQAQRITIREVEHTPSVEKKSSKHVFLQRIIKSGVKSAAWEWLAMMDCWHAVILWNEMTMKDGMIMVECAINGMPRIGIG